MSNSTNKSRHTPNNIEQDISLILVVDFTM